jgi:hypothetical protein
MAPSASACSLDGKEGFLPKNDVYIPARRQVLDENGAPVGGGITKEEFNGVIDAVESVYAPIIQKMGGNLVIERNWQDGTVNAYANREGDKWIVAMFGGLARHKETTVDGFMLVVCHELGHHIGGAPKYNRGRLDEWASNEGESDYFATLKCARRVLEREDNVGLMAYADVPDSVRQKCMSQHRDDQGSAICMRGAMGGLSLARLLGNIGGDTPEEQLPTFGTPDQSKVSTTYDAHPDPQCRLDTYYAGGLCEVPHTEDVDQADPLVGTCATETKFTVGVRPRCWYAPKSNNGTVEPSGQEPAPKKYW